MTGAGLLIPAYIWNIKRRSWVSTCLVTLNCIAAGILLLALKTKSPKGRMAKAFAYIGRHSYAIYLVHFLWRDWGALPIARWIDCGVGYEVWCGLFLGGSVLLGAFLTDMVEAPTLAWRDRLVPGGSVEGTMPVSGRTTSPLPARHETKAVGSRD